MRMFQIKYLLVLCSLCISCSIANAQWKKIDIPSFAYIFTNSYIDKSGGIFLEAEKDIYYSNDLGKTWSKTNTPTKNEGINNLSKFFEFKNGELFWINFNDIYQFNKNTISWDLKLSNQNKLIGFDSGGNIWFIDNNKPGLLITNDFGKTFKYFSKGNDFVACDEYMIGTCNDSSFVIMTRCEDINRYYRVNNTEGIKYLFEWYSTSNYLFVNPLTGTLFTADKNNYLSRSTLGASTKFPIFCNGSLFSFNNLSSIQLLSNGKLLLSDLKNNRFYISHDDGKLWEELNEELPSQDIPNRYSESWSSFKMQVIL